MAENVPARPSRRGWPGLFDWLEGGFPDLTRVIDRPFGVQPFVRIEQHMEGNTLVIRAEMPGIDPDRDVDITVQDDMLLISGERREETKESEEGAVYSEFRYGSFSRRLSLPKGVKADDISASYEHGILEVKVPMPEAPSGTATKVSVTRG